MAVLTPEAAPAVKSRRAAEFKGNWRVLLHRDEWDTFDYAESVLLHVVPTLTRKKANRIAMQAHMTGTATVVIEHKKIARYYRYRCQDACSHAVPECLHCAGRWLAPTDSVGPRLAACSCVVSGSPRPSRLIATAAEATAPQSTSRCVRGQSVVTWHEGGRSLCWATVLHGSHRGRAQCLLCGHSAVWASRAPPHTEVIPG